MATSRAKGRHDFELVSYEAIGNICSDELEQEGQSISREHPISSFIVKTFKLT
jgi:hypothetical protein